MQILVCDDNPYMVNRLFDLIQHQISLQGISSTFSIVSNTDDLHNLDYTAFDLAFLDVDMGEYNGVDLARKLHAARPDAVIVFVTNFIEYAPSGYEVNAFRYVLKNTLEETLPEIILLALDEYKKRHRVVSFSMASENIDVPVENILYLESNHRTMIMHLINHPRKDFHFYASITLKLQLQGESFSELSKLYTENRKTAHDFRAHLDMLSSLLENGETTEASRYLNNIRTKQTTRIFLVNCHHPVLDALLNQKARLAQEKRIDIRFKVNDLSALTIDPTDITVNYG